LLAGAGTIELGTALRSERLTADPAPQGKGWRFSGEPRTSFLADASLAIRSPLHPAIVRNEGAPAPTGNDAVLRHFLGVPGAALGIDGKAGGVESPAVADDQGLPVVFDAAADERRHLRSWGVMLTGSLKMDSITIWSVIRSEWRSRIA